MPFTISTRHQKQILELFCCFIVVGSNSSRTNRPFTCKYILALQFLFSSHIPMCQTRSQNSHSFCTSGGRGGACILCLAALSRRRFTSFGVMLSLGGFEWTGNRATLAPPGRLMLGLAGLRVIGHVRQQVGWWLRVAAVHRPHHQASATCTSSEGGGPKVDGRQADAVGGRVWRHASVVAAAAAARHASFLLEVLSQAPAWPGLFYLCLHLGDMQPWHVKREQTQRMYVNVSDFLNLLFKQRFQYLTVAETVENRHKESLQDDMNVFSA